MTARDVRGSFDTHPALGGGLRDQIGAASVPGGVGGTRVSNEGVWMTDDEGRPY